MSKMDIGTLVLNIIGNNAEFKKSLQDSQSAMGKFNDTVKTVFGGLAVYLSAAKIKDFAVASIKAFAEEEDALISLGAALKATNQYSADNMALMQKQADALKSWTIYSDDQIYALEAQALKFGVTTDKMQDFITASIGLAEITGQDVNTALKQMLLATEGEFMMLNRALPALRGIKDENEKLAYVMQKANEGLQIHGERVGSATGEWTKFKQMIEDIVSEPIGGMLTKELRTWNANLQAWIDIHAVRELDAKIAEIEDVQKRLVKQVKDNEKNPVFGFDPVKAQADFEAYAALVRKYQEQRLIALGIKKAPAKATADLGGLKTGEASVKSAATLEENRNLIMKNRVKILVEQIEMEKVSDEEKRNRIAEIYKAEEDREAAHKAFVANAAKEEVKIAEEKYSEIESIADQFNQAVYSTTVNAFTDMILDVEGSWAEGFTALMDNIKRQVVNLLVSEAVQALIKLFLNVVSGGGASAVSGIGSFFAGLFKAEGGPVLGGKPYIVGERGPEVFVPRGSGSIIPNSKALNFNLYNYGPLNRDVDVDMLASRFGRKIQTVGQGV